MKKVNPIYKLMLNYHFNMLKVWGIRKSLGLISDDKAEKIFHKHLVGIAKVKHLEGLTVDQIKELFEKGV